MANKTKDDKEVKTPNLSSKITFDSKEKTKRKKEIYTGDFFIAKLLIKINSSICKEKKFFKTSYLLNKLSYSNVIEFINDDSIIVENTEISPFIKAKIELLFYKNIHTLTSNESSNYLEYKLNYNQFVKDVYNETNFAALVSDVNDSLFKGRDRI